MKKITLISLVIISFFINHNVNAQKEHSVTYNEKVIEVLKPGLRTSEGLKGSEYKFNFKGVNSTTLIKKGETVELVVSKGTGVINPESDVRIVQFNVEKKKRTTRTFIAGPLNKDGDESPKLVSGGKVELVDENTLKVTVSNLEVGEYALVLGDVNFVKNKTKIDTSIGFHCFSIID